MRCPCFQHSFPCFGRQHPQLLDFFFHPNHRHPAIINSLLYETKYFLMVGFLCEVASSLNSLESGIAGDNSGIIQWWFNIHPWRNERSKSWSPESWNWVSEKTVGGVVGERLMRSLTFQKKKERLNLQYVHISWVRWQKSGQKWDWEAIFKNQKDNRALHLGKEG